jgi:uncharacterized membrane protein
MTNTAKNCWRVVAFAFIGLALVGAGLSLAALSDPKRFSISVADDQNIHFFALSGLACTLAGLGLFLCAVRHTTISMPAQLQRNANIGVGWGFVLQFSGLFLPDILPVPIEIGLALVLCGLPAFVWGAMNYAEGKGHSRWFGLFGLLGILGFIALVVLPSRIVDPLPNEGASLTDAIEPPIDPKRYPTEPMTRAKETHYGSNDATVIVRANSDDAWLFLPVCSLFVSGLGYLTILGPEGIAARHPNIDFNYGLIPFAFAFALALLLAKLYQFRWPTRYATHVTADRIAFYRSSLDGPEYLFHRDNVQSIRIRRPRWFHNPDMSDPIEFVGRSGEVTTIPVCYIWIGNRSEFLDLVHDCWGPTFVTTSEAVPRH